MATITSFTNISQSRKLAEILPLESADMFYRYGDVNKISIGKGIYEDVKDWFLDGRTRIADIPCWSLAALMDVLERGALFKTPQGWIYQAYSGLKATVSNYYSNPVDACYERIIKLHELKML